MHVHLWLPKIIGARAQTSVKGVLRTRVFLRQLWRQFFIRNIRKTGCSTLPESARDLCSNASLLENDWEAPTTCTPKVNLIERIKIVGVYC